MSSEAIHNKFFIEGPITIEKITELISKHSMNTNTGAYNIFLGQVRADSKQDSLHNEQNRVIKIIYSTYNEMAKKEVNLIYDESMQKFKLHCVHIHHSLGEVKTGEISLFVMVSSEHRENCFDSTKFIVEQIKKRVPIWKKEVYTDGSYRWIE
jgi:molybdopterin synthase catalytic subunit